MKRIEAGGRVVYLDRRRLPSLAMFALAAGLVIFGMVYECPRGLGTRHWMPILGYSGSLTLFAVASLLRERRFVIDAAAGTLEVVHRGFFGRVTWRRVLPLKGLRVSTSFGGIVLETPESERVVFAKHSKGLDLLTADVKG
jgi:hypothetical protein